MPTIVALFDAYPELAVFVAIVFGFAIGRVHVKGVGLGTVVGTLLAGLVIGILTKPQVPDLLKWAFFDLGTSAPSARALPADSRCQTCHAKSGAVDETFVQFYPTLIPVARAKHTFKETEDK